MRILVTTNLSVDAVLDAFGYHDYEPTSVDDDCLIFEFSNTDEAAEFMFDAGKVSYYLSTQYNRGSIDVHWDFDQ